MKVSVFIGKSFLVVGCASLVAFTGEALAGGFVPPPPCCFTYNCYDSSGNLVSSATDCKSSKCPLGSVCSGSGGCDGGANGDSAWALAACVRQPA